MVLLYLLESIRSPVADIVSLVFACLGSDLFFMCVTAIIFWCFSKKAAYKLIFTYVIFCPLILLSNIIIRSPFPFMNISGLSAPDLVTTYAAGYSVPSIGIFTVTVLCTVIFISNMNISVKAGCIIAALLTMVSYLYLALSGTWSAIITCLIGAGVSVAYTRFRDSFLFDIRQYPIYMTISFIPSFILLVVSVSMYLNSSITLGAFSCALRITGMNAAMLISWFFENNFVNFSIRCERASMQFLKAIAGTAATLISWFVLYFLLNLIPGFWPAAFICNVLTAFGSFCAFPLFIKAVFSSAY